MHSKGNAILPLEHTQDVSTQHHLTANLNQISYPRYCKTKLKKDKMSEISEIMTSIFRRVTQNQRFFSLSGLAKVVTRQVLDRVRSSNLAWDTDHRVWLPFVGLLIVQKSSLTKTTYHFHYTRSPHIITTLCPTHYHHHTPSTYKITIHQPTVIIHHHHKSSYTITTHYHHALFNALS